MLSLLFEALAVLRLPDMVELPVFTGKGICEEMMLGKERMELPEREVAEGTGTHRSFCFAAAGVAARSIPAAGVPSAEQTWRSLTSTPLLGPRCPTFESELSKESDLQLVLRLQPGVSEESTRDERPGVAALSYFGLSGVFDVFCDVPSSFALRGQYWM